MGLRVEIDVGRSVAAGCGAGVSAELAGLLDRDWVRSRGINPVDFVVGYEYCDTSDAVLRSCLSALGYGSFSLVEGVGTRVCRLVSLIRPEVGFVISFVCKGHPRAEQRFLTELVFVGGEG
jgi:hypothetical protein